MKQGIIGKELMTTGDQGKFRMTLEFDKTTSIAQNDKRSQEIEKYISKKKDKKWVHKLLKTENLSEPLTDEEIKIRLGNKFLSVTAFGIMTFFLGIGIGNGKKVSDAINSNQLVYNHSITFSSSETKLVYLIGTNSANIFYVEKGSKNVKISPVGAIESIEFLKVKKWF